MLGVMLPVIFTKFDSSMIIQCFWFFFQPFDGRCKFDDRSLQLKNRSSKNVRQIVRWLIGDETTSNVRRKIMIEKGDWSNDKRELTRSHSSDPSTDGCPRPKRPERAFPRLQNWLISNKML